MQELTGNTPRELQKELRGTIYQNPVTGRWETADEYLSGNVRQKLEDAEFAAADSSNNIPGAWQVESEDADWEPENAYARNVEALKLVQPRNLMPGEIDAPLGATFIPNELYSAFANHLLKSEGVVVTYIPATGSFGITQPREFTDNEVANRIEHGTAYFSGMNLFEMAMNGLSPVAKDEETNFHGNTVYVKNPEATIEAGEKQRRIMSLFSEWIWTDPERSKRLATKYNRELNNIRLRVFDGSHLTFPGLDRSWLHNHDLDPHQKNAVWRILVSGNTLLAHAVGAGKTLEMIVASKELRRLGMSRKPMFVVPNRLVGQWRDDYLRAYPGSNILVPTKKSLQAKKRARLMSQIATGNYDAVLVGHKAFELLPVKDETFKAFMDEQIDEVENALAAARLGKKDADRDPTVKELVRRKKALEERLKKRLDRSKKDNTVTFEEMGVDWLFVDEAHAFKNLGYMTTMDRIAGLPNTDSNRSVDMLLKSRYVSGLHGNQRGLTFATATPVSNSLAEIWTMMRYLMPDYLRDQGFDQFDAWAKTFGNRITQMEVAPEGNRMMMRTRFSDFNNAPEMMAQFRLVADIRTSAQLNLPTPAMLTGAPIDIPIQPTRHLKNFIGNLGDRADAVRGGHVDPEDDNMLKISSDGRKASLDIRLVNPFAPEDKNGKARTAAKKIVEIYKEYDHHKATQLVFLDLSTPKAEGARRRKVSGEVANTDDGTRANDTDDGTQDAPIPGSVQYQAEEQPDDVPVVDDGETEPDEDINVGDLDLYGDDDEEWDSGDTATAEEAKERFTVYSQLKKLLIEGGIPEDEIAFIQDAKTEAKQTALFAAMNAGEVRVLIGSTEMMGAGMNVQKLLVAEHHLDAPWRPSDWIQRLGRIDRQGNELWDKHQIPIQVYRYVTEGSFDAFMWQTILAKAKPITRLMEGDPSVRRIEEPAALVLSAEQAMAISSGNPEIREKIILDQDINRIEIMRGAWLNEQATINQTLAPIAGKIIDANERVELVDSDIATRDGNNTLVVNGRSYTGLEIRKEGAVALVDLLKGLGLIMKEQPTGMSYHGFDLVAIPQSEEELKVGRRVKQKDAPWIAREANPDGRILYSKVGKPVSTFTQLVRKEDLDLQPLPKAEAELIHSMWESPESIQQSSFSLVGRPALRLAAKAHNFAVSVNYDSPVGTIASADHIIRGFNEDLRTAEGNLRRLEKQKTELESKRGLPFHDDDKLNRMLKRQHELAEKLGENKDDAQAQLVGAASDDENPMRFLLADPTSAMLPEWFRSRKIFVRLPNSTYKLPQKVHVINQFLAVMPEGRGKNKEFVVVHIPTGLRISEFEIPTHAVAFARQALTAYDWANAVDEDAVARWASGFAARELKPPAESPAVSIERLVPKPESEEAKAGPMSRYTSLNRPMKVPEATRGDKGWLHIDVNGQIFSSDMKYVIRGEITPAAKDRSLPGDRVSAYIGAEVSGRVRPVAFSTDSIDNKTTRIVWFGKGLAVDGRYYDDAVKRFPGAVFLRGTGTGRGRIYIESKGDRVGILPLLPHIVAPPATLAAMAGGGDTAFLARPRATFSGDEARERLQQKLQEADDEHEITSKALNAADRALKYPFTRTEVPKNARADFAAADKANNAAWARRMAIHKKLFGELLPDRDADGTLNLSKGDAKYEALIPGEGHVYVNRAGIRIIGKILHTGPVWGVTVSPESATDLIAGLQELAEGADLVLFNQSHSGLAQAAKRILDAIGKALRDDKILSFVDAGHGTSLREVQKTRREENFHRWQMWLGLAGKEGSTPEQLMEIDGIAEAVENLRPELPKSQEYDTEEALIELGALLGTNRGDEVGLSPEEATELFRKYVDALIELKGPAAGAILKGAVPQVRRALGDKYVKARWNGDYGQDSGRLHGKVRGVLRRPHNPNDPTGRSQAEAGRLPGEAKEADEGAKKPKSYYEEVTKPYAQNKADNSLAAVKAFVDFLNPRYFAPNAVNDVTSRMVGTRAMNAYRLAAQLDKWTPRFDAMTRKEKVDFVDRVKNGTPQPDKQLQAVAHFIRLMDNAIWAAIPKHLRPLYLENHFRVLWKVIPGSDGRTRRGFNGAARQSLEGTKGMMRRHTLESMSEGIEMGGVPHSYNPLVLFAAAYNDAMKLITAHELWKQFKRLKLRVYVPRLGARAPEGFRKLDAEIARVHFPLRPKGMLEAGDWYVEKSAAHLLNNMLGRDYFRESYDDSWFSQWSGPVGRLLLEIKNNSTAIELSLSPYHLITEAIEAISGAFAVGARELINLGFGPLIAKVLGIRSGVHSPHPGAAIARGLKTMGYSPLAFVSMAKTGSMAKKMFTDRDALSKTVEGRKFLADNPGALELIPYYFDGGGTLTMPEIFQIHAAEGFKEALNDARSLDLSPNQRKSARLRVAAKAVPFINQLVMKPLFEKYIPYLKLAFFLREFALARNEYASRLASGEMSQGELARRVVTSIENRFGEMNFDKLFWNRTFKTGLQGLARSITWKVGTLGEGWNAISKQAQELYRSGRGVIPPPPQPKITGKGKGKGKGRPPELPPPTDLTRIKEWPLLDMSTSWLLSTILTSGVVGLIATTIAGLIVYKGLHGIRWPKSLDDLQYPDLGNGLRVSLPGYPRDYLHLIHDPWGYIKASQTGQIARTAEVIRNQTFRNELIWEDDDPWYEVLWNMAAHVAPKPFTLFTGAAKIAKGDYLEGTMNVLAFGKAPSYIDKSKAELLAQQYGIGHRKQGSINREEAQKQEIAGAIRKAFQRGQYPAALIQKGKDAGLISDRDVINYQRSAQRSALEDRVKGLTMPEMVKVFDAATPEERENIRNVVERKVQQEQNLHPALFGKKDSETRQLVRKYFDINPPVPKSMQHNWYDALTK
jgi:N12 class adenine-specific DNA methylase